MSQYIFSSQELEAERKRLCLVQDSFDEKSKKHLLNAGLKEGMDCLEVGLGAGSIALWMKSTVNEEGSVLGVDLNTDFFYNNSLDIMEGDILELKIDKKFDLIHLRYVLMHNTKPTAILEKLYSLLKPQGRLVIEEADFTLAKWIDAQEIAGCKRVNSAICKMFENKGLKPHYGSIAHLSMQEIGFEIEDNRSYLHLCSGNEDVAKLMDSSCAALSKAYIQTGLCSHEDINRYHEACKDENSLAVYYATIVVTAVKSEKKAEIKPCIEEEKVQDDGLHYASTDEEIASCFSLMKELRHDLDEAVFLEQTKEQMRDGYKLVYLRVDMQCVCLAGYTISKNFAWGKHVYIDDLVTLDTDRSQRYGKTIMEHLVEVAKENGCSQLHLDSGVQRFLAHKFYMREGFKISSHHFTLDL